MKMLYVVTFLISIYNSFPEVLGGIDTHSCESFSLFIKRTKLSSYRVDSDIPNYHISLYCSYSPEINPVFISNVYFVLCDVFHDYHF